MYERRLHAEEIASDFWVEKRFYCATRLAFDFWVQLDFEMFCVFNLNDHMIYHIISDAFIQFGNSSYNSTQSLIRNQTENSFSAQEFVRIVRNVCTIQRA